MMYLFSLPVAQLKIIYILFELQDWLLHDFRRIPSAVSRKNHIGLADSSFTTSSLTDI